MLNASDYTSIGAIIVSLISLGVTLESRWRDKYKLRYSSGMLVTTGVGSETYQICVEVTNEGQRPISITEISYREDKDSDEFPIISPIYGGMPKQTSFELHENQTKQFHSEEISRKDMRKKAKNLIVQIVDSRGKTYTMNLENEAYL